MAASAPAGHGRPRAPRSWARSRRAREASAAGYRLARQLRDLAISPLAGKELRVFRLGDEITSRYQQVRRQADAVMIRAQWTAAAAASAAGLLSTLSMITAVIIAAVLAAHGQILDEPTASLDAETEHAIFERFCAARAHPDTITLLISHRFSTVRMAGLIVVLQQGSIVERGTHDELLSRGGRYADMYRLQARAYAL